MTGSATTRVGSLLTGVAVAFAIALMASVAGSPRATALSVLAGAAVGVLVLLRARETELGRATASLALPIAALLALAGLGLSVADALWTVDSPGPARLVGHVGVSFAAGTAAAGGVGTLGDGIGDGAVADLWSTTLGTLVPVFAWLGVLFSVREGGLAGLLAGFEVGAFVTPVMAPREPVVGLVTLWLLVVGLVVAFRRALAATPIVELASRSRRGTLDDRLATIDAALKRSLQWLLGGLVVVGAIGVAVWTGALALPDALVGVLALTTRQPLRVALLLGIGTFGTVGLAVALVRRLAGSLAASIRRAGPSILGGIVAIGLVSLSSPLIERATNVLPAGQRSPLVELMHSYSPTIVVLSAVGVALFALATVLGAVALAGGIGLVPKRASAGAIAASGLSIGVLAIGIAATTPVAVFALVALSIVAWDASERGVVTRAELGTTSPPRLEVVQSLGTAAITGAAVLVAALIVHLVLPHVSAPHPTLVSAFVAALATVLLVFVLRS